MPPRMIGLYALATMEREGSVYGYRLAQRIAERTAGTWRPGPGAIYPSLRLLVDRGLARRRGAGRRREYRITPTGRAVLRRVRARVGSTSVGGPDLSALWAEVVGSSDVNGFLLRRLRRALDDISSTLARRPGPGAPSPGRSSLRADVIEELAGRLARLRAQGERLGAGSGSRSGGRRR